MACAVGTGLLRQAGMRPSAADSPAPTCDSRPWPVTRATSICLTAAHCSTFAAERLWSA